MTASIPDKLERLRELLVAAPKEPPTPSDRVECLAPSVSCVSFGLVQPLPRRAPCALNS